MDLTYTLSVVSKQLDEATYYDKALSFRAVYLLPSVRNDLNVAALVQAIVFSRAAIDPTEAQTVAVLVSAFAAVVDRKAQITSPTIPFDEWISLVLDVCEHNIIKTIEPWRALPVLAGIMVSKSASSSKSSHRAQGLLIQTANVSCSVVELAPIITVALAASQAQLADSALYTVSPSVYLAMLEAVVLDRKNWDTMWTFLGDTAHFGRRWAMLKSYDQDCSNEFDVALNMLTTFVVDCSKRYANDLAQAKLALFSVLIHLEGIASGLLVSRCRSVAASPYFAAKILKVLPPLYYVVNEAGTLTIFDFVLCSCLDVLTENPVASSRYHLATLCHQLQADCKPHLLATSKVECGKIVYALDLYEHVIGTVDEKLAANTMLPLARQFLVPSANLPSNAGFNYLFESAHSVVLAHLRMAGQRPDRSFILDYADTVLALFPQMLSPHQFDHALQTLASVVTSREYLQHYPDSHDITHLCHALYRAILQCDPEIVTSNKDEEPRLARVFMVGTLIHIVPLVETAIDFERWLQTISVQLIGQMPRAGASRLWEVLWETISNDLGVDKADLGISWWCVNRPPSASRL